MTCEQFEEIVHGLVRLELFDVSMREAAFAHAWSCEHCAPLVLQARALAEASDSLVETFRAQEAPAYIEPALLETFRERHKRLRSRRRVLKWEAVAAAVILLFSGWISYRHWKGSRPLSVADTRSASVASISPASSGTDQQSPAQPRNQGARQKAVTVSKNNTSAVGATTTAFVPVPFAEALGPHEAGLIVRVQLTPAALDALGYSVNQADTDSWLNADVLVGEDGWPRAVRLVR